MSEILDGLRLIAGLFARYTTTQLEDEDCFVGSVFERDLSTFASRLALFERSGGNPNVYGLLLQGTGLQVIQLSGTHPPNVPLPLIGAVVSGELSISYFIPRRDVGTPQNPILAKSIVEGSTFYISDTIDCDFFPAANTRLLIWSHHQRNGAAQVYTIGTARAVHRGALSTMSSAQLLDQIEAVDFENLGNLVANAGGLLAEIASRRDLLRALMLNARSTLGLRDDCELLNEFYKYVLHRSRNDIRLRLHVFRPDAEVSPHAHRWAMVSYVLSGPCANKYYGSEQDLDSRSTSRAHAPQITHRLQVGSRYAFADQLVHWFLGAPGAATLTLRGPARKVKASEFRAVGVVPKFGIESKAEPSLRMTDAQFDYGIRHLEMTNVL